jgi:hypothetical protein
VHLSQAQLVGQKRVYLRTHNLGPLCYGKLVEGYYQCN